MSDPWLTIIGLTEDGVNGLAKASLDALAAAEIIFGGPRHLALVGAEARGRAWPIPFSIEPILAEKGLRVVVLTSGDPFWFGAGSLLAERLAPHEYRVHPAPSVFSLAAAAMGWPLQEVLCFGLHAMPYEVMRPQLHEGARLLVTLRDEKSPRELENWLAGQGFGASELVILEHLGGPKLRILREGAFDDCAKLVAAAITVKGEGLPRGFGLPDAVFATDGQITKQPIRAMTLASLGPRKGEVLWDLGAGSGSISAEWCLNGGFAHAVETRADRGVNISENARRFGLQQRMVLHIGRSLELIETLPQPDAVFIGGGASQALIDALWQKLPANARLVINSVTLETEALLIAEQAKRGGTLLKIALSEVEPLGSMRGWAAARPVVQWSVRR